MNSIEVAVQTADADPRRQGRERRGAFAFSLDPDLFEPIEEPDVVVLFSGAPVLRRHG
ncbi:MAG: hypothetical protein WKF37_10290 [Bryobacteraceae bacterium]